MTRVVIAGGGLAGSLAALALARRRPDIDLLLVESADRLGGNHIWSFFDTDVAPEHHWVLERINCYRWSDHAIRFPRRSRTIPIGYNSIRSPDLDAAVRSLLRPDQLRLGATVSEVGPTHLLLGDGERIDTDAVIDARGAGPMPGLDLGWQKFVGRVYRYARGHGLERPVIMDATVPQHDGYRFLYLLPLSTSDVLIEDTYYSRNPLLDQDTLRERLDEAASAVAVDETEEMGEESGVLPVVIDGDFEALWPTADGIPRLGVRGGFFHPTTSYSLPDAIATAALLAEQDDFSPAAIHGVLRHRAERLWRERGFFRLLNRMLFRAAEPQDSYRVLEHFYRLPPDLIGRFYAGRLSGLDKLRILSGRPPVPIGRAIAAIFGRAA